MKLLSRVEAQRASLYLGVSAVGMTVLIGAYCFISSRSPAEALGNLWIAVLIAFIAAVATALRDQRHQSDEDPEGRHRD